MSDSETEPMACPKCNGSGCPACGYEGWVDSKGEDDD
jgi:hypothetical protein